MIHITAPISRTLSAPAPNTSFGKVLKIATAIICALGALYLAYKWWSSSPAAPPVAPPAGPAAPPALAGIAPRRPPPLFPIAPPVLVGGPAAGRAPHGELAAALGRRKATTLDDLARQFQTPDGFAAERAWHDDTLEAAHNFIQRWFPMAEPSQIGDVNAPYFNPANPAHQAKLAELRGDATAQAELLANFKRILDFWGFATDDDGTNVRATPKLTVGYFATSGHNYPRATRVLRSMILMGRRDLALDFHRALVANQDCIQAGSRARSLGFFAAAVAG